VARDRSLERVELDVYASNVTAIRLYEKFKFQVVGRKRKARKLDASYEDTIVMALLFDQ
jgi:RimJ/RimL family protein N-acetyltransferase